MNQIQTDNNDLQKAIDDITNNTNADPVFSDPVAAPSTVPEGDTGELAEPIGPFPEPKIEMVPPAPEPLAPIEPLTMPNLDLPEPPANTPLKPLSSPAPEAIINEEIEPVPQSLNTSQVKKAALRDLVPLLDHLDMDSLHKFNLYRDIFEDIKDYTVLEPAYRVAREIADEKTRAEALLYLVEAIDKM